MILLQWYSNIKMLLTQNVHIGQVLSFHKLVFGDIIALIQMGWWRETGKPRIDRAGHANAHRSDSNQPLQSGPSLESSAQSTRQVSRALKKSTVMDIMVWCVVIQYCYFYRTKGSSSCFGSCFLKLWTAVWKLWVSTQNSAVLFSFSVQLLYHFPIISHEVSHK